MTPVASFPLRWHLLDEFSALTERTAAVVDSGPVVQPSPDGVGPGRGEDAPRPVRSVSAVSSSAAATAIEAGTASPQPASPASSASPGTTARGTGGGRFTPDGSPLAHVPGHSPDDASLPGVPAGGVQAPGKGGTSPPEPTQFAQNPTQGTKR